MDSDAQGDLLMAAMVQEVDDAAVAIAQGAGEESCVRQTMQ